MQKRGQITLFILVSIVIILAFVGFFLFSSNSFSSSGAIANDVQSAVESCISDVTSEAVLAIGESGGYFSRPYEKNEQYIAYHYRDGASLLPSLSNLENEMGAYVDLMLPFCLEEVYSRDFSEYVIDSGEVETTVSVHPDDTISFDVSYPYTLYLDNSSLFVDEPFKELYEVKLYTMYLLMQKMNAQRERNSHAFCMSCFTEDFVSHDIELTMWDSSERDVVFVMRDLDSSVLDKQYLFMFVYDYEGGMYDAFGSV